MLYQLAGTQTRILGSLHRVPVGATDWIAGVEDQCVWASEFAVEMHSSKGPALFSAPTGQSVSRLPEDLAKRLKAIWPASVVGPWDGANMPGAALIAMIQDTPTDPGVESVVEAAASDGRALHELEDVHIFHSGFTEVQTSQFSTAIRQALRRGLSHRIGTMKYYYEAWQSGNLHALHRASREELPLAFERPLFADRNAAWAPKVAALASRPIKLLVCVGAAHLCGPSNLLDILRRDHGLAAEEVGA